MCLQRASGQIPLSQLPSLPFRRLAVFNSVIGIRGCWCLALVSKLIVAVHKAANECVPWLKSPINHLKRKGSRKRRVKSVQNDAKNKRT